MKSNDKEPYIKEKSIEKLENTNSFIMPEEMLVDDSDATLPIPEIKEEQVKETVEKKEEIKKETKKLEEKPVEVKKTPNKEKKTGVRLVILSLLFLPILFVFAVIGMHSHQLVKEQFLVVFFIFIVLLVISFIIGILKQKICEDKIPVVSKTFKILFSIFMSFYILGSSTFLFILYGPYKGFRDWLIPTAMTTLNHQYFATWFFDEETIEYTLSQNTIIESGENTDLNLITVGKVDFNATTYVNEYEKQILSRTKEEEVYKIIPIKEKSFKGYLVAVYDASRISVATSKYLGTKGELVTEMAATNKALVAINGGGFVDPNYNSNGGVPQGIVIKDGKVVSRRNYSATGGLIGFTKDNKLLLGRMTADEALKKGVRDAVSFGPFLIVNGKRSFIKGNGGWGTAPRTAIGQRKDGIVLLLVVDGRTLKYPGADMIDLTDIMEKYGAYNAANLDGGTSSVIVFPEKVSKKYLSESELKTHCIEKYCYINDPIDGSGNHETRPIATSLIVK